MSLLKALFGRKKKTVIVRQRERGFIDLKTGRRVEVNPATGREYFID